ncbi:MAG TPA: DUF6191 domain-containing protein [Jatrophihabitans sp.]|nr:DUF6191 domain-containing protein [Jatrophihabitans sp.]
MTEWGIDTLFNPGKRHMDEEKRRLQSTREEIGDSSGGRRIDLESGVVRIARKNSETGEAETDDLETGEAETDGAETDGAETDELTADDAETTAEAPAPTGGSAAERARARRLG